MINITMDARYIVTKNKETINAMVNDRGIVRYPIDEFNWKRLNRALESVEDIMIDLFKVKLPDPNKDY